MAPKIAAPMESNRDGIKTSIPVPAGTMVTLHVPGIHYNRMLGRIASGTYEVSQRGAGRVPVCSSQRG
jgi:hypothetical protein